MTPAALYRHHLHTSYSQPRLTAPGSCAAWLAGALLTGALPASVAAAPSIELGYTSEATPAISLLYDWQHDLSQWHPALSLRLATGLMLLPGDSSDDNAAWRFTPALRYGINEYSMFIEGGLGTGLFLHTELDGRSLSTAVQFESRLAVGVRFAGGGELGASAAHYSNGGMDLPNDGFEVYSLVYRQPL